VEQTGYHVGSRTRSEGGYVAVVPAFPGCYSQGESAEDTLSNAREAILLTIKELRQRGTRFQTPGASSYTAWP
jgi:predicted RNase H-like HicB family nuclease